MKQTHWYTTKSFLNAKSALYSESNYQFIFIVGTHGSGKSTILSGLTDFCPIRPLAFLFSCHPDYRKSLFELLLAEMNTIPWEHSGILFADEYDDNNDIAELVKYIKNVEGRFVLTCHPENLETLNNCLENPKSKKIIEIAPLDEEDAKGIWVALAKRYEREDLEKELLWMQILEYSNGLAGKFIALSMSLIQTPGIPQKTDVLKSFEKIIVQDHVEQGKRRNILKRGYVLRYPDGTEGVYRSDTPIK